MTNLTVHLNPDYARLPDDQHATTCPCVRDAEETP